MKKQIGVVGVDSGQIVICDPCYIDSEWKKEEFTNIRKYRHRVTREVLQYRVDFKNYEQIIEYYDKNMNQMIRDEDVEELPAIPAVEKFSYNACCKLTTGKNHSGQLHYCVGHAGVAVVASSGYGDGTYPVFATYNKDNRIIKLEINFI